MRDWCHRKVLAAGEDDVARRMIDAGNHAGSSTRSKLGAGIGKVLGGDRQNRN